MTSLRTLILAPAFVAALATMSRGAAAQASGPGDRSMASREELQALVTRLEGDRRADPQLLARVRTRLANGDFHPGDRVWLTVQGDTALTDTFTVWPDQSLHLPSPTVGSLSLTGTLRSELQPRLQTYVARFVRNPVVRARPLVRVSIQGEVRNAGYYAVPADVELSEVFMAAGGTTPNARTDKARLEREGRTYLEGRDLQMAMAGGNTLDEAGVREGDQFVMPKRGTGVGEGLRFTWLLVSLTGGVIALSRAVHR